MAKLTKETIDFLLQPGTLFQDDGSIITAFPLEGEALENADAAYRIGFLHEDMDTVLKEVNTKRGFALSDETSVDEEKTHQSATANLIEIFGHGTVLHEVEIDYRGIIIRIGNIDL